MTRAALGGGDVRLKLQRRGGRLACERFDIIVVQEICSPQDTEGLGYGGVAEGTQDTEGW